MSSKKQLVSILKKVCPDEVRDAITKLALLTTFKEKPTVKFSYDKHVKMASDEKNFRKHDSSEGSDQIQKSADHTDEAGAVASIIVHIDQKATKFCVRAAISTQIVQ